MGRISFLGSKRLFPVFTHSTEFHRFWEMLYTLVARDIKSRSRQAFLGYVWVVLEPLLATGVFTILIQNILRLNLTEDIPYPVFVFSGMILWRFFSTSLTVSAGSLIGNYNLITQVHFPRKVLIFYPIVSKLVDFGIAFISLLVVVIAWGLPIKWTCFLIIVPLLLSMILIYGLGLLVAPVNVAGRDMSMVISVLLGFFLYATPVLYPVTQISAQYRNWYFLNPIAVIVEGFRGFLLGSGQPPLWAWGVTAGVTLALLLLGHMVFSRFETVLADVI